MDIHIIPGSAIRSRDGLVRALCGELVHESDHLRRTPTCAECLKREAEDEKALALLREEDPADRWAEALVGAFDYLRTWDTPGARRLYEAVNDAFVTLGR